MNFIRESTDDVITTDECTCKKSERFVNGIALDVIMVVPSSISPYIDDGGGGRNGCKSNYDDDDGFCGGVVSCSEFCVRVPIFLVRRIDAELARKKRASAAQLWREKRLMKRIRNLMPKEQLVGISKNEIFPNVDEKGDPFLNTTSLFRRRFRLFGGGKKFTEVRGKEIVQEGWNDTKQEDDEWVDVGAEECYPGGSYSTCMTITNDDDSVNRHHLNHQGHSNKCQQSMLETISNELSNDENDRDDDVIHQENARNGSGGFHFFCKKRNKKVLKASVNKVTSRDGEENLMSSNREDSCSGNEKFSTDRNSKMYHCQTNEEENQSIARRFQQFDCNKKGQNTTSARDEGGQNKEYEGKELIDNVTKETDYFSANKNVTHISTEIEKCTGHTVLTSKDNSIRTVLEEKEEAARDNSRGVGIFGWNGKQVNLEELNIADEIRRKDAKQSQCNFLKDIAKTHEHRGIPIININHQCSAEKNNIALNAKKNATPLEQKNCTGIANKEIGNKNARNDSYASSSQNVTHLQRHLCEEINETSEEKHAMQENLCSNALVTSNKNVDNDVDALSETTSISSSLWWIDEEGEDEEGEDIYENNEIHDDSEVDSLLDVSTVDLPTGDIEHAHAVTAANVVGSTTLDWDLVANVEEHQKAVQHHDGVLVLVSINGKRTSQLDMMLPPKIDMMTGKQRRNQDRQNCIFVETQTERPTTSALEELIGGGVVNPGSKNLVVFTMRAVFQGGKNVICFRAKCQMHVWAADDSIIISDIDGTLVRNDDMVDSAHKGVCEFYTSLSSDPSHKFETALRLAGVGAIRERMKAQEERLTAEKKRHAMELKYSRPKYIHTMSKNRVVYVTSRSLQCLDKTRNFLSSLRQSDVDKDDDYSRFDTNRPQQYQCQPTRQYFLPQGPLLCCRFEQQPNSWKHQMLKTEILATQVTKTFGHAGRQGLGEYDNRLFMAAFASGKTETQVYAGAGVHPSCLYSINRHTSEIICVGEEEEYQTSKEKMTYLENRLTAPMPLSTHFLLLGSCRPPIKNDQEFMETILTTTGVSQIKVSSKRNDGANFCYEDGGIVYGFEEEEKTDIKSDNDKITPPHTTDVNNITNMYGTNDETQDSARTSNDLTTSFDTNEIKSLPANFLFSSYSDPELTLSLREKISHNRVAKIRQKSMHNGPIYGCGVSVRSLV